MQKSIKSWLTATEAVAEDNGCEVSGIVSTGKHLKFYITNGSYEHFASAPATPSCHRALLNHKSTVRKVCRMLNELAIRDSLAFSI